MVTVDRITIDVYIYGIHYFQASNIQNVNPDIVGVTVNMHAYTDLLRDLAYQCSQKL